MVKITAKQRKALPKGEFAVPSKAPKSGSYPIDTANRARNALARASGKPVESQVKAAVKAKFPNIKVGGSPSIKQRVQSANQSMKAK